MNNVIDQSDDPYEIYFKQYLEESHMEPKEEPQSETNTETQAEPQSETNTETKADPNIKKSTEQIIGEHTSHYDYYEHRDWTDLCEIMSS